MEIDKKDTINLELDAADTTILAEAIIFYTHTLAEQGISAENVFKILCLQGISKKILDLIEPKAKQEKFDRILLQALKREKERGE